MSKVWLIWKYSLGSFSDTKTENYDNYVFLILFELLLKKTYEIIMVFQCFSNKTIENH